MSSTIIEKHTDVEVGQSEPLGAQCCNGGVNFSVFSKNATGMELILFPSRYSKDVRVIRLDPETNRTYYYWHVFVPGIGEGQEYGFRAHGPYDPSNGSRFDPTKLLLDPYARGVTGWDVYDRKAAGSVGQNWDKALRSIVVDHHPYDWENDALPRRPYAESVIYEMHVGGFTRNANSGVSAEKRGTFAGVIEKIPYLKELGVTAVELMPVQEFDSYMPQPGLENYWGYNTLAFFAPHHGYCISHDPVSGISEFRDMVKALHKAGIEVILDVVFNHTSEGNERGPTHSFRGLDNQIYYQLDNDDKSRYSNYSGCGNSFNANHPVVGRLILDSLRYWVSEMHVDGFRFDLAAALARDVFGRPLSLPPLLWTVESDPVLAGTKLIAEAWDAAGLYRVGWFINASNWYAEWNGPFRDDVRSFIKGDTDTVQRLAARIMGSNDIYVQPDREPNRTINFVTCHDGFTLFDLVSYNTKHNESNGELNADGNNSNFSWNCGVEGATDDESIQRLRMQQMKNMLVALFVSQGTPMLLMGDEVARTQNGNNNAYCHNTEKVWFDWSLIERNKELLRFTKEIISFTQELAIFKQRKTISETVATDRPFLAWHGAKLSNPDWSSNSHTLAFTIENPVDEERLHVIFNAYWESIEFEIPSRSIDVPWRRIVDTALPMSDDISPPQNAAEIEDHTYMVMPRSAVVLYAGPYRRCLE